MLLRTIVSLYIYALCCASDLEEREKFFSEEATTVRVSPADSSAYYVQFCKDIKKRLENPSGDGDSLLKSMCDFYEDLKGMHSQLEANKTNVYCKTFYMALDQTNGPEYLRADINSAPLLDVYKWTNFDVGEAFELISDTKVLWGKIRTHAERLGLDKMEF